MAGGGDVVLQKQIKNEKINHRMKNKNNSTIDLFIV